MGRLLRLCLFILVPVAPLAGQSTAAPRVSREAFASLRWLEGRWVGSGGGYAAFHESYVFLNDSTIEQREHADSTFGVPSRTSTIAWRDGVVRKERGGRVESILSRVSGDTARFVREGSGGGGFTWIRVSADEWRAEIEGARGGVTYVLKRHGRAARRAPGSGGGPAGSRERDARPTQD